MRLFSAHGIETNTAARMGEARCCPNCGKITEKQPAIINTSINVNSIRSIHAAVATGRAKNKWVAFALCLFGAHKFCGHGASASFCRRSVLDRHHHRPDRAAQQTQSPLHLIFPRKTKKDCFLIHPSGNSLFSPLRAEEHEHDHEIGDVQSARQKARPALEAAADQRGNQHRGADDETGGNIQQHALVFHVQRAALN